MLRSTLSPGEQSISWEIEFPHMSSTTTLKTDVKPQLAFAPLLLGIETIQFGSPFHYLANYFSIPAVINPRTIHIS